MVVVWGQVIGFFALVVVVSASGVLSPGPLFVATVGYALRGGGRVGWLVAAGHMAFELPLVFLLSLGAVGISSEPFIRLVVGFLGSAALIVFGVLQTLSSIRGFRSPGTGGGHGEVKVSGNVYWQSFLIGVTFTALNPYFIIWWLTVGFSLIVAALELASYLGIALMYVFHIWMDYAWLGFVSHTVSAGRRVLDERRLHLVSGILSAIIIALGVFLLYDTLTSL